MAVNIEVDGAIAVITINRPEARNAIDAATTLAIAAGIVSIETDPNIRVGIITGAGGYFCAGMDLKAFLRNEVMRTSAGFAGVTEATRFKPLIAAVEGFAFGGGFEIAMACDLIVASEQAQFGLPETKRGLVANAGGLWRLPRQVPTKIAMELALTGDTYSAAYLAKFGLINRTVPPGQALAAACTLAATIAGNGPLAVAASRRVVLESQDWNVGEMFERQRAITMPIFSSEDAREGAAAFAEKRTPKWRGV